MNPTNICAHSFWSDPLDGWFSRQDSIRKSGHLMPFFSWVVGFLFLILPHSRLVSSLIHPHQSLCLPPSQECKPCSSNRKLSITHFLSVSNQFGLTCPLSEDPLEFRRWKRLASKDRTSSYATSKIREYVKERLEARGTFWPPLLLLSDINCHL